MQFEAKAAATRRGPLPRLAVDYDDQSPPAKLAINRQALNAVHGHNKGTLICPGGARHWRFYAPPQLIGC